MKNISVLKVGEPVKLTTKGKRVIVTNQKEKPLLTFPRVHPSIGKPGWTHSLRLAFLRSLKDRLRM